MTPSDRIKDWRNRLALAEELGEGIYLATCDDIQDEMDEFLERSGYVRNGVDGNWQAPGE